MPKSSRESRTPSRSSAARVSATRAGLGHEDALGELERGRADAGSPWRARPAATVCGQRRAVQVAGRDVDRDGHLQPDRPPLRGLRERGVDDVAGEPVHEAGVLGQRDEVVGEDQAALRVPPAHERLDAR